MGTVLLVLLARVLGSFFPAPLSPLQAQDTPADTIPADSIRPVLLPGIQVRMLRTPLVLGKSPLSLSVLDIDALRQGRSGISLEESLQALPGLQIQNRYNYAVGERVVLRGIGARTQFGVRGIRILMDDIPATLPDGQSTLDHLDLFSLGSVEVLRGPAASLYGNGAAGVIRFRTQPPPPGPNRTQVQFLGGSYGLRRMTLLSGGTLGATGYLLSGGSLAYDGFRGNPVRGRGTYGQVRRWNGNIQVTRPLAGGRLRATLNILSQDSENPGSLSRSLMAEDRTQAYPFNIRQGAGEGADQTAAGLVWKGSRAGLEAELEAHGILRDVWNPIPPAIVDLSRRAGGVRGLIRGQWIPPIRGVGGLNLDWTLGTEMDGQWDRRRNLENEGSRPGAVTLDQAEAVLATGGFAQGYVDIGRQVGVLLGLRYDRVRFRARDRLVGPGDPDDSGARVMDAWSPSAGLRIDLTDCLSVRGSASTFFQTPTTSELANRPDGSGGFNPRLQPQRGRSLEVGVLGGGGSPIQVEGTLFQTRITDELVPFEVPHAPGRVFFRNAGASRYRGAELAAFALLPGGVRFRGAYTLIDARFRDFTLEEHVLDGNRIPGVAPHRVDLVWTWRRENSEPGVIPFLEVRALYQGRIPADDRNLDAASPFALLDLRGGFESVTLAGTRWTVFAGATNVADRQYTASVAVNAFGSRYFEPGPGRSVYLGIRSTLFPFGDPGSTLTP